MLKVFMAEDDSLLVHVYEKIFKANGYEIIFGMDGEESIAKLKEMEVKPSIVFLDIMMPRKNGFEVMQEMKEDTKLKDIPIIFLTNLYEQADEKKGLSLGAAAYLIKSQYVPSEIVAKAKEICDKICAK
jgi:DNA-binding response OmpR family regulator